MKSILAAALALALAACATAPRPLQGEFSALLPADAAKRQAAGEVVRWGGHIVNVDPQMQRSCFEIVAAPLGGDGRPRDVDRSEGRFIACRAGFYDPEVFKSGREVTISGRIEGFESRKVGGFDYPYPRVAADVVYLWPEKSRRDVIVQSPFVIGYSRWW